MAKYFKSFLSNGIPGSFSRHATMHAGCAQGTPCRSHAGCALPADFSFPSAPPAPVHGSQCNASGIILRRSACLSACSPWYRGWTMRPASWSPESKLPPSSLDTPSGRHRTPRSLCRPADRWSPNSRQRISRHSSEPAGPSAPPRRVESPCAENVAQPGTGSGRQLAATATPRRSYRNLRRHRPSRQPLQPGWPLPTRQTRQAR